MGKREDNQLEIMMEDWVSVNKFDDPQAWAAWRDWRFSQMGCHIEPIAFTVPSPFPPTTISAAQDYIKIIKEIRKQIGWKSADSKVSKDVIAYKAPAYPT